MGTLLRLIPDFYDPRSVKLRVPLGSIDGIVGSCDTTYAYHGKEGQSVFTLIEQPVRRYVTEFPVGFLRAGERVRFHTSDLAPDGDYPCFVNGVEVLDAQGNVQARVKQRGYEWE